MRCLFYAVGKWIKEGGYLCIRMSKVLPLPHFIHATSLKEFTHMTGKKDKSFWKMIWWCITGKNYTLRSSDDDHKT